VVGKGGVGQGGEWGYLRAKELWGELLFEERLFFRASSEMLSNADSGISGSIFLHVHMTESKSRIAKNPRSRDKL